METMFKALHNLIKEPLRTNGGVKTDNSILLIYPPDKELDFREYLLDTLVPAIEMQRISYRLLDLSGFLFAGMDDGAVASLQEDEFDDYRWMQQGLSKRAEAALHARFRGETSSSMRRSRCFRSSAMVRSCAGSGTWRHVSSCRSPVRSAGASSIL